MEAFGSGQTSISPEFLQNIQSAVNSQGVLGQVQVIQTENGPVTVLFMEEGADASSVVGENPTTINVSSAVDNYVVNTEPAVTEPAVSSESSTDTQQYEFVLTEEEYNNFLQGQEAGVVENVATTETVEEVTSIPPVINMSQVGQEATQTVTTDSAESDILYATALPQSASQTETTIEGTTVVPENSDTSSDTYYITEHGEVIKIDSSYLAENRNAFVQMQQDSEGGLQVISQEDTVYQTDSQPAYTSILTDKPAVPSQFELTATKVDSRLVIDAPKEEPKVLSYKTTNRQRVNIMRQPVKTSPKQAEPIRYSTTGTQSTAESLLPSSLKVHEVAKNVGAYTASPAPKQKVAYPATSNVRQTQIINTVKTINPKLQSGNVIKSVASPQMVKKTATGLAKQVVNKVPISRVTGSVQTGATRTILAPKFNTQGTSKNPANTIKYQTDLLMSAMEQANVNKKSVVPANPMVVRDPSTTDVVDIPKPTSVNIVTPDKPVLQSMPLLEPEPVLGQHEQMEIDQSMTDATSSGIGIPSSLEEALLKPIPGAIGIDSVSDMPTDFATVNDTSTGNVPVEKLMEVDVKPASVVGKPVQPKLIEQPQLVASTSNQPIGVPGQTVKTIVQSMVDNDKGTQLTDIPKDDLKSIDVPDSDVSIQLFADGTLVTKDKSGTNFSTVRLEDLGLDMSMLESNTDIELLIVQGDGKEVRATINTSKHVNPVTKSTARESTGYIAKPATPVSKSSLTTTMARTPVTPRTPATPRTLAASDNIDNDVGPEMMEQGEVSTSSEARPYKCSMCPRTFKFYRTYRCHEIVHTKAVTFTCHLCKRLFAREVNLQSHLELHRKKAALKPALKPEIKEKLNKISRACYDCGKIFDSEGKMKKHYKTAHEVKPRFPCALCGNLFNNMLVLQKHMKVHVGPFACPHCDAMFEVRTVYDQHILEKHADLMHTCEDCNTRLPSKQAYAMHCVFQHKEKSSAPSVQNKQCLLCDRQFDTHQSLERHMIFHSTDKFIECPKCSESFKTVWQLEKHVRESHDNDVEFPCRHCEEVFNKYPKWEIHGKLYHNGPYQCQTCYEEFPQRVLLEEHQFASHDGGFTCSKCEMKFENSSKKKQHLATAHPSRIYPCELCDMGFERKPQLRSHMIDKHLDGDKNKLTAYPELKKVNCEIICDLCGEYFNKKAYYKQHIRDVHFGGDHVAMVKIFPLLDKILDPPALVNCDHCGKSFQGMVHLNRHMKSHMRGRKKLRVTAEKFESGDDQDEDDNDDPVDFTNIEPRDIEKDYNCKKCSAKFSRKAALEKHIATRHRKDPFKEALKTIEKEEHERAELEEREGFTPAKSQAGRKSITGSANKTTPKLKSTDGPSTPKKIVCLICEQIFKTSAGLAIHLETVHSDRPDEEYLSDASEKKGYSIKNLHCLACDKHFTRSRYLRKHLRSVHKVFKSARDQTPITCPKCDRTFDNTPNRDRHYEAKHQKKNDDSDISEEEIDTKETGDITSFLGMNFNLAKTSACNMESVKIKQHKCTICGKGFSRESTLKKHISFHDEEDLEKSIKMETEDDYLYKPVYPCKNCKSKYATGLSLIHHNRSKHADVDEETILAYILEIDEKHKAESPKKTVDKDLKKSVKRKADSPKVALSSPPGPAKKKLKLLDTSSKKGSPSSTVKVESPQKIVKYSKTGRMITSSQKLMEQIQCEYCSKTFLKEAHLVMHISRKHFEQDAVEKKHVKKDIDIDLGFTCSICNKSFDQSSKLKKHNVMKHNIRNTPSEQKKQDMNDSPDEVKAKAYICDVCEQPCATQKNLDIHKRTHSGEKPYGCCICNQRYVSKFKLECHLRKAHAKQWNSKVRCKICLALFDAQKAMLKHKIIHLKPSASDKVKDEQKPSTSNKVVPHQCTECGKSFRSERNLNSHMDTHHEDTKVDVIEDEDSETFTCGVCNKMFPDKETIKKHMDVHKKSKTDEHVCKKCDRVFTKAIGLKLHNMSVHKEKVPEPEVQYQCGFCDRSFAKKSSLRMHEVTHTGTLAKSGGNFSCNICNKNFKSKESLLGHMLTHTTLMPHQCDICMVSFKHAFSLKAHQHIHTMKSTSKKPEKSEKSSAPQATKKTSLKCSKCKKQFSSMIMLKAHIRKTHSSSKAAIGVGLLKNRVGTRSSRSASAESKNSTISEESSKSDKKSGNFSCKTCKKSFTKSEQLKVHMEKMHSKKKTETSSAKKTPVPTKSTVSSAEKTSNHPNQKLPSALDCPNCSKRFTTRYNLRLHLMNTHKAKMHKLPANAEPSKKKWLYCKDCVSLFWCQTQYNNHFKRCNKSSENEKSADAEVKVEPADSGEEIVEFKTIQHKCEFCLSVFYTKKLFDMHIAKNHPDHMEEYGIVPDPALELVNDSEDLMGNLISGGIYDVEKCKKLSAMPVVSLKRYIGTKQSVILGKDGVVTDDEPESEQQKDIENVTEAEDSSVDQGGDEAEKMDDIQETEIRGDDQDQQKGGDKSTTVIQEVTDQEGEVHKTLDEHNNVLAGIKITENFDDDSEVMAGIVITKNTDESFEDISEVNERNTEVQTLVESMEEELHQSEAMEVDDNTSEKAMKDIELATVEEDGKIDSEENLPDEGISEEVKEAETDLAAVSEDSKEYGENTGSEVKTVEEVEEKFEVVESRELVSDAEEPQSTVVEDEAGVSTIESDEELVRDESPTLVSYDDVSGNSEGEENGGNTDKIIANETVEDVDIDSNIQVGSVELAQSDNNTTDSDDIMPLPQVYRQNEISASPELEPTNLVNEQTDNTEAEGNEISNEIDSGSVGLEQTVTDDYNLVDDDVAIPEKTEDVPSYDASNEEQL